MMTIVNSRMTTSKSVFLGVSEEESTPLNTALRRGTQASRMRVSRNCKYQLHADRRTTLSVVLMPHAARRKLSCEGNFGADEGGSQVIGEMSGTELEPSSGSKPAMNLKVRKFSRSSDSLAVIILESVI